MSRPKLEKVVSPKGVAKFPKLTTPDTKFKPEGEYSVKLLVPADEAQPLVDKIEAVIAGAFAAEQARLIEAKKAGAAKQLKFADKAYRPELDNEGNETGNIQFTFKSKASYTSKEGDVKRLSPPMLVDAKGVKLPANVDVWGGSIIKCAGELNPFATAIGVGVSLRLNGVQVIELRSGNDRSAASLGFEEEEGYTTAETNDFDAPAADDATAPNEDF